MTLRAFLSRLIFLCVLPLAVLAFLLAGIHVAKLRAHRDQEARDQARNIALAIDRDLQARVAALQVLAASPFMDDPPRLTEFYEEAQGFRAAFTGHVVLADCAQHMLVNTRVPFGSPLPPLPVPRSHSAAAAVVATGKPAIGDAFQGPIAAEPLVAAAVPVTRDGRVRAILLSIIETQRYQQFLDELALRPGHAVMLLDGKQDVLARRPPLAAQARPAAGASVKRLVTPSSMSPWTLVLEIPRRTYLGPIIFAAVALALAVVLVAAASIVGGRLISERLARAVESLTRPPVPGDSSPPIAEIERVRATLHEAAAATEEALDALRQSEARYRNLFESANVGKSMTLPTGEINVNRAFADMLGYDQNDLRQRTWQELTPPEDVAAVQAEIAPLLAGQRSSARLEKRYIRRDGSCIWADVSVTLQRDAEGRPLYFITTIIDITARRELEVRLRQAQKMEAIGRLAGGVAHDFNNMLALILGYAELALEKVRSADPIREDLTEILRAARRSADITRQLLAFARKQSIAPRVIDLNSAIEGMLKMLRRLIGESIDLGWTPGADLWPVHMDPSQIDQVLANLCVNARDAIDGAGTVLVATVNLSRDELLATAAHPGVEPGDYVLLTVSDNGRGMEHGVVERIFEPFYTTKGLGQGTGLGLATVYGIVEQNHGRIRVVSAPGQGTTFHIYLPRHTGAGSPAPEPQAGEQPRGAGETVLVVEDEAAILALVERILTGLGYATLTARAPGDALALSHSHPAPIDLLITDVIMPGMTGPELAQRLSEGRPGLRTLFMSGHAAEVLARRGLTLEGAHLLPKPFTRRELAAKVREALGR